MNWRVFQGSARGGHHIDQNIPCQDYIYYQTHNQLLCAVVCDGAGSASLSDQGAAFFAEHITKKLISRVDHGPYSIEELTPIIEECIAEVRDELTATLSPEHTLRDYAATVVGCLMSSQGGCFFHIGDGFGVYQLANQPAVLSLPENGEYASETFFVTGDDWKAHLRLTLLSSPEAGTYWGLMSDGAATFAIDKQRTGFFPAFINPVLDYLKKVDETAGSAALPESTEGPEGHSPRSRSPDSQHWSGRV